jgi:hypothetical protein
MKYVLKDLKDEHGTDLFAVIEQATKHVINAFLFRDDADKYHKFLSNGGAFNGFTPDFMTQKVKAPSNPNVEFEKLLKED